VVGFVVFSVELFIFYERFFRLVNIEERAKGGLYGEKQTLVLGLVAFLVET